MLYKTVQLLNTLLCPAHLGSEHLALFHAQIGIAKPRSFNGHCGKLQQSGTPLRIVEVDQRLVRLHVLPRRDE
ncbi:hypothetical protein D3C81_1742380 [compost metagenome]